MSNNKTNYSTMKNRLLFLVSLFALSLCTWEVHALNTVPVSTPSQKNDIEEPPPGYEKINLLGDLLYNIGPNAIVAGANDDAVYIGFNQSFGKRYGWPCLQHSDEHRRAAGVHHSFYHGFKRHLHCGTQQCQRLRRRPFRPYALKPPIYLI